MAKRKPAGGKREKAVPRDYGKGLNEQSPHKVPHCQSLSLPLRPQGTLMTQNEFSSVVFTLELEEKLFLIHRTSRLERAPRFTVSWFMVGLVYSGPPEAPALKAEAPPSSFPAAFSQWGVISCCARVRGGLLLGQSAERGSWGLISSSFAAWW